MPFPIYSKPCQLQQATSCSTLFSVPPRHANCAISISAPSKLNRNQSLGQPLNRQNAGHPFHSSLFLSWEKLLAGAFSPCAELYLLVGWADINQVKLLLLLISVFLFLSLCLPGVLQLLNWLWEIIHKAILICTSLLNQCFCGGKAWDFLFHHITNICLIMMSLDVLHCDCYIIECLVFVVFL